MPSSTASPSMTNEVQRFRSGRLRDQRILVAPVVAVPSKQPDALALPLNDQAVAIMFDLVKPVGPGRDPGAARGDAGQELSCEHGRIDRPSGDKYHGNSVPMLAH